MGRYQTRLLAFCRHMLGSREDAEDVLQEVFAAAYNAMLADDRPINARPWLYRIARNRSLNHLRKVQPIGVDSMDVHLFENGTTTADKVDKREQFRELIADVQQLPETQRTALLLREIDALSYEQIAEAMETTIPSVKSLLVRARVSLAEAAEARQLSCDDVRVELGEIAEGLRHRTSAPVRRHLRECERCTVFRTELRATSKALALMLPVGPLLLAKRLLFAHIGLSSAAGAGAGASGGAGAAASGTAAAGAGAMAGAAATAGGGGLVSAGIGAVTTKAAAGIAAAALVTAGAVEIERHVPREAPAPTQIVAQQPPPLPVPDARPAPPHASRAARPPARRAAAAKREPAAALEDEAAATTPAQTTPAPAPVPAEPVTAEPGHTHVETGATTLPATTPATTPPPTLVPAPTTAAASPSPTTTAAAAPPATTTTPAPPPATTTPAPPAGGSTTPATTTTTPGSTTPGTTTPGTTTPTTTTPGATTTAPPPAGDAD